jgi:copper resistance protein B
MKNYLTIFSVTCLLVTLFSPLAQAQSNCTPEHAAMGHCTMDAPKVAQPKPVATVKPTPKPLPQTATACTPEHAAMGHCTMPTAAEPKSVAPNAASKANNSCQPEHAAMGHCTLEANIPVSDGSAATNIPMPYHQAMDMNDDPVLTKVMIDRLEVRNSDHSNPVVLEADAWFGKSIDKLWLKTDVEAVDGKIEEAELQVLYNRAISPFWDIQAGLRQDFKPFKRTWAAVGVQGTAPYFIETNATAFIGKSGQSALRLSAEKEVMLTQKTALIPEASMTLYGKTDHELEAGAGISDLNIGLRLSHEIKREFAPYVGVNWSKKLGNTADMAEHHGEKTQNTEFLLGVKVWF